MKDASNSFDFNSMYPQCSTLKCLLKNRFNFPFYTHYVFKAVSEIESDLIVIFNC